MWIFTSGQILQQKMHRYCVALCRWRWCSGCCLCLLTEIRTRCLGLCWLCPALRTAASPWGSLAASPYWSRSCMRVQTAMTDTSRPRQFGRPNPEQVPPSTTSSTHSKMKARPTVRWGFCIYWNRSGPTATAAGTGSRTTQEPWQEVKALVRKAPPLPKLEPLKQTQFTNSSLQKTYRDVWKLVPVPLHGVNYSMRNIFKTFYVFQILFFRILEVDWILFIIRTSNR